MKIGYVLPTFTADVHETYLAAERAISHRVDGLFFYDHLWPVGEPERPALSPFATAAAVAQRVPPVAIGTLVARITHGGVDHLEEEFDTLARLTPGPVIAGVGLGDEKSRDELAAYGLPSGTLSDRVTQLDALVGRLSRSGHEVWIGGNGEHAASIARRHDVERNLWRGTLGDVSSASAHGRVNWAGPVTGELSTWLDALAHAGATWAILTPASDLSSLREWREVHPLD